MPTADSAPRPLRVPGGAVIGFGVLTSGAGVITWLSSYSGVYDWRLIAIGITITGFGVTWVILGYILRTLTRRP